MEKYITEKNTYGKIIMLLYYLCSSYMDQFQAKIDSNLKVVRQAENVYHFSYLETEFDFSIIRKWQMVTNDQLWMTQALRKFRENYKMLDNFWEENTYMVEGYVNSYQEGKKVLNCWIEEEIDGMMYVKDINRNLMMKKEDYEQIFMPIAIKRDYKEKEQLKKILIKTNEALL